MSQIQISHEVLMSIKDALDAGEAVAEHLHQKSMDAGKFDKALFDATQKAVEARIMFKIWILDKVPAVEMEVT